MKSGHHTPCSELDEESFVSKNEKLVELQRLSGELLSDGPMLV